MTQKIDLMVVLEMQSPLFIRGIINTATQSLAAGDRTYSVLSLQSSALGPVARVAGIVALWAAVMAAALALNRATILIMVNAGERVPSGLWYVLRGLPGLLSSTTSTSYSTLVVPAMNT